MAMDNFAEKIFATPSIAQNKIYSRTTGSIIIEHNSSKNVPYRSNSPPALLHKLLRHNCCYVFTQVNDSQAVQYNILAVSTNSGKNGSHTFAERSIFTLTSLCDKTVVATVLNVDIQDLG